MRGRLTPLGLAALVVFLMATAALGAPPSGKPPHVSGVKAAPPPAWVESGAQARWLAFGSYCWATVCADMLPPAMRPNLPVVRLARPGLVRLHLAFRPSSLSVRLLNGTKIGKSVRLPARAVVDWRPSREGVAVIDARGARGSASYVFRLTIRSGG